jgi:hypothetical protein
MKLVRILNRWILLALVFGAGASAQSVHYKSASVASLNSNTRHAASAAGAVVRLVDGETQPAQAVEPQPTPTPNPPVQFAAPDVYELTGGGVSVTYLPTGAGGLAHLTYQDPQRTLNFSGAQIRRVKVADLGTIVSVTIVPTVDSGSTTFSILIPAVNLPNQRGASTFISTDGVTTVHKFSIVPALNQGQRETYTVTSMTGTASLVIIPL